MDATTAQAFAAEWIEAWNTHDLDRIVEHYAADIVFLSPVAQQRVGNGRVVGQAALRVYWAAAIGPGSLLQFTLLDVLAGHDCLTILYRNHRAQTAAETFEFNTTGKVVRSFACYG